MRILHAVASGERRGAETFASDLVFALDGDGIDQRVVVLRGELQPAVPYRAPVTLLGANGRRVPGARLDLMALRRFRRVIREWQPSLLQAHGGETLKYAVVATAGLGVPVVYRRIGLSSRVAGRGPRRVAYGRFIRRAAQVVAVGDVVRQEVVRSFRVPDDRVHIIPNAVDPRRLRPRRTGRDVRRELGVPDEAVVVLSAGALTWDKDPATQALAMAEVLRARPDAWWLIAGDGSLRHEIESAVGRLGLQGRARLLGSRADVPDLLAASDVLLLASQSEGMPAILIEAGLMRVPAVATSVGSVSEVVRNGETGLLARPGDVPGLSSHLLLLAGDEGLRRRMGAAAHEWCRSQFDIRQVAARYLELYREVVEA